MSLERLNPGTFVEVDDPVMGGRKLGLIDETGVGYFDIHGEDELPKPVHSELNPVGLGTINAWGTALPEDVYPQFVDAWDQLTRKNLDVLTIARALRWGIVNNSFDAPLLERMGINETDKIVTGRRQVAAAVGAQ